MTFWWHKDPIPGLNERLDVQFAEVRRRKPAGEQLALAVIGEYRRFTASCLFKTASRTQFYKTCDFAAASDELLASPNTQIILWSPNGEEAITRHERARIPQGKRVLNDTQFDSRKRNVQAVFERISSRSLSVDPVSYDGIAVVKSDRNAEHDGALIKLPIKRPADGCVYERLIENLVGENFIFDIRVPFFDGLAPLAYIKLRPRELRFQNVNHAVALVAPGDVLSWEELTLCRTFCREIGLEYGEIDVLRDRRTGEIFIVDANNTPAGPPGMLSEEGRATAIRFLATAMVSQFFKRP